MPMTQFSRAKEVYPGLRQIYPQKPKIRKLGTIDLGIVESTPIAFKGELYRFVFMRPNDLNPKNPSDISYSQFINCRSGWESPHMALDHQLCSAYTDGGVMYVTGIANCEKGKWDSEYVSIFRSEDLIHWEMRSQIHLPGWGINNTNICRMGDTYTLLVEISKPIEEAGTVPFTFRFLQSKDLVHWELTPRECVFQKDRYAGGPSIYTVEDDPHYYVGYLEAYPGYNFANCLARSQDLIHWEYSPLNPVLMYEPELDKQIASPFLTEEERYLIEIAQDSNNSDMELCEYNGRTIIYYCWGNQHADDGPEFLAEACFEGTLKEFLTGFFQTEAQKHPE